MRTSNGCICYLVRNTPRDLDEFSRSLSDLHNNYWRRHPCDVYAYHEEDLTEDQRKQIAAASPIPLRFVELKFELPVGVEVSLDRWALGYRHMCHFFANDIFHRPELQQYKYYMRLDTDSHILSPVGPDLFTWAERNEVKYGYINNTFSDQPFFATGLWQRFAQFVDTHPEYPTYKKLYTDIPELRVFYTNFELCDLSWFRSTPWSHFFSWVDLAQGIYYHRWGDHTIRYGGVNLYMHPKHIQIAPIHYYHQFEFGLKFK